MAELEDDERDEIREYMKTTHYWRVEVSPIEKVVKITIATPQSASRGESLGTISYKGNAAQPILKTLNEVLMDLTARKLGVNREGFEEAMKELADTTAAALNDANAWDE